ncbi:hypothetical protein ACFQWH_11910 [Mycolicibacterium sp. GCM10028919]|uniref:hypothetical protein n=1 Tax=Mycolicibacterium sp. GCM10028919 TaxID=3273401 RepID=UPI0036120FC3
MEHFLRSPQEMFHESTLATTAAGSPPFRDVLAFSTRETAEILDTTSDAVDAALRRARSGMASAALVPETMTEPPEAVRRDTVSRYVSAFERSDSNARVELLRADVEFEMPPTPT